MEINISGIQGSGGAELPLKGQVQKISGGGDPKAQIAKDISDATASVNSISTYENQLSDLNQKIDEYTETIQFVQKQIDALPDSDPRRTTASSVLWTAQTILQMCQTTSDHLVQISNDFKALQDEGNISNPTPDQAAKADALAAEIATLAGQIPSSFPGDPIIAEMDQAIAQTKIAIQESSDFPGIPSADGAFCADMGPLGDVLMQICSSNKEGSQCLTEFYQYSKSVMDRLRNSGATEIDLSYTQFMDVFTGGTPGGALGHIDTSLAQSAIANFIQAAKDDQLETKISFGGPLNGDYNIFLPQREVFPEVQADKLFQLMEKYGIGGADFEIDKPNVGLGANAIKFFQNLHQNLNAVDKSVTLTLPGDFTKLADTMASVFYSTPEKAQKALTAIQNGTKPPQADRFDTMFDTIQLQLSGAACDIIPSNKLCGVEQWCDIVGDASKVRIGFDNAVHYKTDNHTYPFDLSKATSDAQAAAMILYQLQEQLNNDGYNELGSPFWRYEFDTSTKPNNMREFYDTLDQLQRGIYD